MFLLPKGLSFTVPPVNENIPKLLEETCAHQSNLYNILVCRSQLVKRMLIKHAIDQRFVHMKPLAVLGQIGESDASTT